MHIAVYMCIYILSRIYVPKSLIPKKNDMNIGSCRIGGARDMIGFTLCYTYVYMQLYSYIVIAMCMYTRAGPCVRMHTIM